MTRVLKSLVVATMLLLAGCSYFSGVRVEVRPESAEAFKEQAKAFLHSKGYGPVESSAGGVFFVSLMPRAAEGPRRELYAAFFLYEKVPTFVVGKMNNRSFTGEEKKVVGEFIDFLVQHSAMIQSAAASSASTNEESRAAFNATFKKI